MDPKEKPANPAAGIPPPGYSPANGTGSTMTGQGEDMRPEPIRRKGRKTLAKIYDSLSDPEEAPDRSRIIGLPTKKEARDIRDELTAAAWAGGKTVSRIQTAKEYISIVESFFRKLRAIKNTETRTPQTGIPSLRELLRDTRVTNLDEHEKMLEILSADTAILLVGGKDLRGKGARILLALNETRLSMGKATILLAHGTEKDHKAVLPAYKPKFYRR